MRGHELVQDREAIPGDTAVRGSKRPLDPLSCGAQTDALVLALEAIRKGRGVIRLSLP